MKKLLFLLIVIALFGCSKNSSVSGDYLNFTAVGGPATISLDSIGNPYPIGLQYSTNGCMTWHKYAIGQDIKLKEGKTVYFKATSTNEKFNKQFRREVDYDDNDNRIFFGIGDYYCFEMDGSLSANGNIMSLIDETLERTDVPACCFSGLFYDCESLIHAPKLPAITVSDSCYAFMFWKDGLLKNAPELPATQLANDCYEGMFNECASLKDAPILPASKLADGCYYCMFSGCSSLMEAPVLPVTELKRRCSASMFEGCTSLKKAPNLPATELTERCYDAMFLGCTSLTQTPELPATTLASECYAFMFANCTSLTKISALPAQILEDYCYEYMFWYCTSLRINNVAPGEEWILSVDSKYNIYGESHWFFYYATLGMFDATYGNVSDYDVEPNYTYYVASAE